MNDRTATATCTGACSGPKVTIAIPTFNRRDYLEAALRSSLAQTYANLEVIVSDNASTDGTPQLLAGFSDPRLVTLRQDTNLGMMGNWDACLARASGTYFILLSDDDLLEPEAIATMVDAFSAPGSAAVGAVYVQARIIGPRGELRHLGAAAPADESAYEAIQGFFNGKRPTYPCTILLRTEDLRAAGGYSYEGLTLACDARAWMAAAIRRGRVRFIPQLLASYRVHPGGLTLTSSLETWLDNNDTLAHFCAQAFRERGEAATAARLLLGCQRLNARSAAFLIRQIPELRRHPLRRLARFVSLKRYFASARCLPVVAAAMARLATPEAVLRTASRLKRLRHSPC